jgi:hypothetical protein
MKFEIAMRARNLLPGSGSDGTIHVDYTSANERFKYG